MRLSPVSNLEQKVSIKDIMMDLKGKKGFKVHNVIVIPLSEDVKKGPLLTEQSPKLFL